MNQDPNAPQNATSESSDADALRYYTVGEANTARLNGTPLDLAPGAVYIVDEVRFLRHAESLISIGLMATLSPDIPQSSKARNFGDGVAAALEVKNFGGGYENPQMHVVPTEEADVRAFMNQRDVLEGTRLVTVVYAVELVSSSGRVPAGTRVTYGLAHEKSQKGEAPDAERSVYTARSITERADMYWQAWRMRRMEIGHATTWYAMRHMYHAGSPGSGKDA